jgi:hypothetical protein
MADRREVAGNVQRLFDEIDTRRMIGILERDLPGFEGPIHVTLEYEVCGTCEGKGTHVNPSIDSHGLSAEDFDEDPDLAENYFGGLYDVPCAECKGERLILVPSESRNDEALYRAVMDYQHELWADAREQEHERRMGY